MATNCYACAAPLSGDFKGKSDIHCKYCTTDEGELKARPDIQAGIAQWFMSWQPDLTETTAMKRAALYMRSMPAWADE